MFTECNIVSEAKILITSFAQGVQDEYRS